MQSDKSLFAFFLIFTSARYHKCMKIPFFLSYCARVQLISSHLLYCKTVVVIYDAQSLLFILSIEMNMYCLQMQDNMTFSVKTIMH